MNVSYQEFSPSAALAPFIDCYWSLKLHDAGAMVEQHCLPLGTQDMIFLLSANLHEVVIAGQKLTLPPAYIAGLYDMPVTWSAMGGTAIFGIRMKPECMLDLFRVPVSVLFNELTEMDTFFGSKGASLTTRIQDAPDTATRIRLAEAFLLAYLRDKQHRHNYVLEATRLIRAAAGNISLDDLSSRLCISPRQLQRSFKDSMGTNPKAYMRIIRFANAYEHIQHEPDAINWAGISYRFGYADQAHFIRDFRQFTGKVPTIMTGDEQPFHQMSRQPVC